MIFDPNLDLFLDFFDFWSFLLFGVFSARFPFGTAHSEEAAEKKDDDKAEEKKADAWEMPDMSATAGRGAVFPTLYATKGAHGDY